MQDAVDWLITWSGEDDYVSGYLYDGATDTLYYQREEDLEQILRHLEVNLLPSPPASKVLIVDWNEVPV